MWTEGLIRHTTMQYLTERFVADENVIKRRELTVVNIHPHSMSLFCVLTYLYPPLPLTHPRRTRRGCYLCRVASQKNISGRNPKSHV